MCSGPPLAKGQRNEKKEIEVKSGAKECQIKLCSILSHVLTFVQCGAFLSQVYQPMFAVFRLRRQSGQKNGRLQIYFAHLKPAPSYVT